MQHDAAAMRDAVEGWREVLREEGRDRHLCDTASGFRQWSRDQARDSCQETWCAHRGPRGLAQATETSPLASLPPPVRVVSSRRLTRCTECSLDGRGQRPRPHPPPAWTREGAASLSVHRFSDSVPLRCSCCVRCVHVALYARCASSCGTRIFVRVRLMLSSCVAHLASI